MFSFLGDIASKVLDRFTKSTERSREQAAEVTKSEAEKAPTTIFHGWRAYLCFLLTILLFWEFARVYLLWYDPTLNLPPSMRNELWSMLMLLAGM